MASPQWAVEKLAELQVVMADVWEQLNGLSDDAAKAITDALVEAWQTGANVATTDLKKVLDSLELPTVTAPVNSLALQALASETVATVTSTHTSILRAVEDGYRQAVARTSAQVLAGTHTRREATQAALDDMASAGLTSFTDKAGRKWKMDTYAEMATRTATAHAAIDGHNQQLERLGHDLVLVSDSPRECELCRPWEGKVLSLSGDTSGPAIASVAKARMEKLFHPNCTHSLGAYFPGITPVPMNTENAEGYEQRQRQREIERKIREWKRREAVALDEDAKAKARERVKRWQEEARANASGTNLRRRNRERTPGPTNRRSW